MNKKKKTMDGNTAAAYAAYAFTEVAGIYPITPSSAMAEYVDKWSAEGRKNLFGQTVKVSEMQSEAGAAGVVHGALTAGALTTTFTASQGLLLMIPNMYKIAGELLPGVIHVSARALASHALSIFGDHSDVMACRQTGFAMLASVNAQEVMDLGSISHLSAIKGRVPFLHFFDGFRTSHEIQKIELLENEVLIKMLDMQAVDRFRKNALNPEHPVLRGTAQNPDIFFQAREASNKYYIEIVKIVEEYMEQLYSLTGRKYGLVDFYGHKEAERIIVAMGSVCDTIEETIDYLIKKGEKVGCIKIRLYRPFPVEHFLKAIPKTVKRIAVLDRTKEPGAIGEPLYQDVCTACYEAENKPIIVAGRYGLGSKDTTPEQIIAVYDNLRKEIPKNHFSIGIEDDVTHLSLDKCEDIDTTPKGNISCKFWGLGSDGTVGANKNSIKIIGDHTDLNVQAYFYYDSKKSGGVTVSHLRFGKNPIKSTYLVSKADFVACHNPSYLDKYDMVSDIKDNGIFLINSNYAERDLNRILSTQVKEYIFKHNVRIFTIDANRIARELGLGNRINMIMQAAFFKLLEIIPLEDAVKYMKDAVEKTYGKKGDKIIAMNCAAVDKGIMSINEIKISLRTDQESQILQNRKDIPEFISNILEPMNAQKGDKLPVSAFIGLEDGTFPQGTSKYEKRGIALEVPEWQIDKCIQCNQCAYVCPHAVIRPFLLEQSEVAASPSGFASKKAIGKDLGEYHFRLQLSVLDCTGCGNCVQVCPAKEKALIMKTIESQMHQTENWKYAMGLSVKNTADMKYSVKGSQFQQPLLEFSGACAGCGETPYAKLITQLFGDKMMIANATGCSSIWAGSAPSTPYTVNNKGHGPAWANSLFEDNAEFGYGMYLAVNQTRSRLKDMCQVISEKAADEQIREAAGAWIAGMHNGEKTQKESENLLMLIADYKPDDHELECAINEIIQKKEFLVKKSQWIFGGDGWAYDIGFGGLDHVIATGEDVNILIFDTELYSNTGGQASKSTPMGSVAQFAAAGKPTKKKDLGKIAMSYGYVYVAQVAMGANYTQLLNALKEAENYPGPSIIIAYAPCINHGLKSGMGCAQLEEKMAVEAGYWHLYRYNPLLKEKGENPFILDSKQPTASYRDFIMNETRYSSLMRISPQRAEELFQMAEDYSKEKYEEYKMLSISCISKKMGTL